MDDERLLGTRNPRLPSRLPSFHVGTGRWASAGDAWLSSRKLFPRRQRIVISLHSQAEQPALRSFSAVGSRVALGLNAGCLWRDVISKHSRPMRFNFPEGPRFVLAHLMYGANASLVSRSKQSRPIWPAFFLGAPTPSPTPSPTSCGAPQSTERRHLACYGRPAVLPSPAVCGGLPEPVYGPGKTVVPCETMWRSKVSRSFGSGRTSVHPERSLRSRRAPTMISRSAFELDVTWMMVVSFGFCRCHDGLMLHAGGNQRGLRPRAKRGR